MLQEVKLSCSLFHFFEFITKTAIASPSLEEISALLKECKLSKLEMDLKNGLHLHEEMDGNGIAFYFPGT